MTNPVIPAALREALENYDKNEHPYHYATRCMAAALRWARDEWGIDYYEDVEARRIIAALEQESEGA